MVVVTRLWESAMFACFNRFELILTRDQAHTGYHQGQCDDDIAYLRTILGIENQLQVLPSADVRAELQEYGAWDDDQLADHDENLSRLLWLACGDIVDQEGC